MVGDELRVEQSESAGREAGQQMRHGDFRAIGLPVEHRFAEEGRPERQPVEPAHQLRAIPHFDGMDEAPVEQRAVEAADFRVDPGGVAVDPGRGTAFDHTREIRIHTNLVCVFLQRLSEAFRDVIGLKRNDATQRRTHPEQVARILMLGHGKDAGAIGPHDQFGGQVEGERVGLA